MNHFHQWLSDEIFKLVTNDLLSEEDLVEALECELNIARDRLADKQAEEAEEYDESESEDEEE